MKIFIKSTDPRGLSCSQENLRKWTVLGAGRLLGGGRSKKSMLLFFFNLSTFLLQTSVIPVYFLLTLTPC